MKCPECDASLPPRAQFCHHCGLTVEPHRLPANRRVQPTTPLAERDETVLWRGSFSALGLIHCWLLAGMISIVLPLGGWSVQSGRTEWYVIAATIALVWLGLGLLLLLRRLNVHYQLTDQRLIHRSGILLRRTHRIELIDIDDVAHEQGLIERCFDVGTIEVISSDRSHPVVEMPGIHRVEHIAMLIDDARRRERIRRGIHIEQV